MKRNLSKKEWKLPLRYSWQKSKLIQVASSYVFAITIHQILVIKNDGKGNEREKYMAAKWSFEPTPDFVKFDKMQKFDVSKFLKIYLYTKRHCLHKVSFTEDHFISWFSGNISWWSITLNLIFYVMLCYLSNHIKEMVEQEITGRTSNKNFQALKGLGLWHSKGTCHSPPGSPYLVMPSNLQSIGKQGLVQEESWLTSTTTSSILSVGDRNRGERGLAGRMYCLG